MILALEILKLLCGIGLIVLLILTGIEIKRIQKYLEKGKHYKNEPTPPTEQSAFNKYLENFVDRELRRIEEYIKFKEAQGKEDK